MEGTIFHLMCPDYTAKIRGKIGGRAIKWQARFFCGKTIPCLKKLRLLLWACGNFEADKSTRGEY